MNPRLAFGLMAGLLCGPSCGVGTGTPDAGAADGGLLPRPDAGADAGAPVVCDAGTVLCDGQCSVIAPDNGCGAPGCTPCASPDGGISDCGGEGGRLCQAVCPAGTRACAEACVAPAPANGCGAADCVACALTHVVTASCAAGACDYEACASGFEDVDGDRTNGCEAPACGASEKRCPDGACRPAGVATGCGTVGTCEACPVRQPVEFAACVSDEMGGTRCGSGSCIAGFVMCNGECVGNTRPEFGCGNCQSCAQTMQNALIQFCADQGGCDYLNCSGGYSDTDGDRSNGCETPPPTCAAGQKSCGAFQSCRDNPFTGCAATSCAACPGPTSGFGNAVCDAQVGSYRCGVECNPGYKECGTRCARGDPALGCDGASCSSCASTVGHAWNVGCYGADGQSRCGYFICAPGWYDADGDRTNGCEAASPGSVRPEALQVWLHAGFGFVPGARGTASWSDLSPRNRSISMAFNQFDGPAWTPATPRSYARHLEYGSIIPGLYLPTATAGGSAVLGGEFTVLGAVARQRNESSFLLGVTTNERLNVVRVPNPLFPFIQMVISSEWVCEPNGCMSLGFTSGSAFGVRRGQGRALLELTTPVTPVAPGATQFLRFVVRFSVTGGFTISAVDQAGVRTTRQFPGSPVMSLGTTRWDYLTLFDGAASLKEHGYPEFTDRLQDGIGELVIYNAALSDAEIATIEAYQRAQWGF